MRLSDGEVARLTLALNGKPPPLEQASRWAE